LKGKRYQLEYLNYIDHPAADFIKHHQSNELCKRNQQDLNWILQHPWVLQTPQKDEMGKKYAFTAVAPSFKFLPIKILDEKRSIKAFLILSIINGHLKVPYAFWEKDAIDWIVQTIVEHIKLLRVNMVTIFNKGLARKFSEQKHGVWFNKEF